MWRRRVGGSAVALASRYSGRQSASGDSLGLAVGLLVLGLVVVAVRNVGRTPAGKLKMSFDGTDELAAELGFERRGRFIVVEGLDGLFTCLSHHGASITSHL